MPRPATHYDQAYFDQWYRDPSKRVSTTASSTRKAAMVVAVAEYYLERPVRSALDLGCGEGQWQPILEKLRPGIRYLGIDPSEYAVARYGQRRNLRLGGFGELARIDLAPSYDVVICSDALYYVSAADLRRGLEVIVPRVGGIAFLEVYTGDEILEGDTQSMQALEADTYRQIFRQSGLTSCGPHCYVGKALAHRVTALERGGV